MKQPLLGSRIDSRRNKLPVALCSGVAGVLLSAVSPVALAVQNAFPEPVALRDGEIPILKLATQLSGTNPSAKAVRYVDRQPVLKLQPSTRISSQLVSPVELARVEQSDSARSRIEKPLKLAQVMTPTPYVGDGAVLIDGYSGEIPSLRMSRRIGMPGAAGVGIPQGAVPGLLVPTTDQSAGFDDELLMPGLGTGTVGRYASDQKTQGIEESSGPRWRIPPIRWGGSLGYTLSKSWADSGTSSLSQGVSGSINASSYFYAPWAATVSGRLGWLTSQSSTEAGANVGNAQGSQSQTSSFFGGGEISVLPSSRFPFQAYVDRSDSRGSGSIVTNDYISTRIGFRQNYRSVDGVSNAGGQFDHSTVTSNGGSNDSVTSASVNFSNQIEDWRNGLSARYSLGENATSGARAELISLSSSHSAVFEDNLNVGANLTFTDNALTGGNLPTSSGNFKNRFLQLNASGNWMPEFEDLDDLPLSINGGLRFGTFSTESNAQNVQSLNYGGNLGAMYRFSNNFSMNANGSLTQFQVGGTSGGMIATLGAGANYVGNPLSLGKYSYNWQTGTTVNWQGSSGNIPSNLGLGGNIGHSISRFFVVSDTDTITLSVSQTGNSFYNQTASTITSLVHSLNAGYGLRLGDRFNGNINASLSDVNTQGNGSQHYTSSSVGLFGVGQLTNLSSLNVNLQFAWSRQQIEQQNAGFTATPATTNDLQQRMTLMGSASYTHARFAGLRGLRYELLFTADTRLLDQRLLGNTTGDVERSRWTLTNRWTYRLGMLDFRTNLIFNDAGGRKNALLFFQVVRQLGAY